MANRMDVEACHATPVVTTTEDEFECAICMECFTNPCTVYPCNHIYCMECLQALQASTAPRCPQCRAAIEDFLVADEIEKRMAACYIICTYCNAMVLAKEMKGHKFTCPNAASFLDDVKQASHTEGGSPGQIQNRSTFRCPYCMEANLLSSQLIDHCNQHHAGNKTKVVCPICAAMPWGDPNLQSSNFLQHLNIRHKFEYDTYVDFEQDDDAMLQLALHASLDG
ncbi:E3 ubiquitin-protein ligase RNF166-like [Physella acuta]|uniref:E3 ubiquitin-protein ligase RNF166-like n=1 Tax=Physella acuta TaxID=109671 RepID=UPI0027DD50D8|nr:E3 ubiquitin-protein ligase RNF166-like [Physella acuta]XP_059138495.1 E3 ubiquitin-protein ligase RNF166-like [Physella acuta]